MENEYKIIKVTVITGLPPFCQTNSTYPTYNEAKESFNTLAAYLCRKKAQGMRLSEYMPHRFKYIDRMGNLITYVITYKDKALEDMIPDEDGKMVYINSRTPATKYDRMRKRLTEEYQRFRRAYSKSGADTMVRSMISALDVMLGPFIDDIIDDETESDGQRSGTFHEREIGDGYRITAEPADLGKWDWGCQRLIDDIWWTVGDADDDATFDTPEEALAHALEVAKKEGWNPAGKRHRPDNTEDI